MGCQCQKIIATLPNALQCGRVGKQRLIFHHRRGLLHLFRRFCGVRTHTRSQTDRGPSVVFTLGPAFSGTVRTKRTPCKEGCENSGKAWPWRKPDRPIAMATGGRTRGGGHPDTPCVKNLMQGLTPKAAHGVRAEQMTVTASGKPRG